MKVSELKKLIISEIRNIVKEEVEIGDTFDKKVALYQELSLKKQQMINTFIVKMKGTLDVNEKKRIKEEYILNMKELEEKLKQAEDAFNDAIAKLDIPEKSN